MSKQVKITIGIIIVLLIILAIFGFSKSSAPVEAGPIKIGVSIALTGDAGFLGEGAKQAMELAASQRTDTKYTYELIFEDDQMDPTKTATAVNKLISVDDVDFLVTAAAGPGNVASPIAEKNKVIHFSITSDTEVAKGEYNFIHWTPPEEEVIKLMEELRKNLYNKIALLSLSQQGTIAVADTIKERLKENSDIALVFEDTFTFGTTDFRTMIKKAEEASPDIFVVLAFSPEIEIIAKQLKEIAPSSKITSIEAFGVTQQRDLFEGMWFIDGAAPTEAFSKDFEKFAGYKPTTASPNAYDVYNLIVNAVEANASAGEFSKERVLKTLSSASYDGAVGSIYVGEDGVIVSEASVAEIRNGEVVVIR